MNIHYKERHDQRVSSTKAQADRSQRCANGKKKKKRIHRGVCSVMNLLNDKDVGLNTHRGIVGKYGCRWRMG